jgi:hypothetical protein
LAERLCRNDKNAPFVILNEVKNLMHSIRYITQILRRKPQNDIAHSPRGANIFDGNRRKVPGADRMNRRASFLKTG